jgi:hypothetical protein
LIYLANMTRLGDGSPEAVAASSQTCARRRPHSAACPVAALLRFCSNGEWMSDPELRD